jgi:hypothetical protein
MGIVTQATRFSCFSEMEDLRSSHLTKNRWIYSHFRYTKLSKYQMELTKCAHRLERGSAFKSKGFKTLDQNKARKDILQILTQHNFQDLNP